MTYCVGWKYQDSVYLIADTAVTKAEKPQMVYSTFGQLHSNTKNGFVEESLLKLVPINESVAVAFSGDIQVAQEIIEVFIDNANYAKSAIDLIRLANSMGPFNPKQSVSLLIASSTSNGDSELIKWDTENGIDNSIANFFQIGSLTSYHADITPILITLFTERNLAVDRVLPVITSVVQSYGVHDNLIQMNVGGLMFGLYTTQGKIQWQEDTNYFLYSPNSDSAHHSISVIARENVLIVSSSITNDIRIFANSKSVDVNILSNQDWINTIKEQLDSNRYRYWVFISLKDKVITLIIRDKLDTESKYVQLTNLGKGKFDLAMSPELITLLRQPLEYRNDNSIPFRLNIRND